MGTGWSQEEALHSSRNAKPNPQLSRTVAGKPGDDSTKTNAAVAAAVAAPPPPPLSTAAAIKAGILPLPHNYEAIMRDVDAIPAPERDESGNAIYESIGFMDERSRMALLYNQLCDDGVYLMNMKQKYWIDRKSYGNCFMLFARELSITWGDDKRYWNWPNLYDICGIIPTLEEVFCGSRGPDDYVDVAELLNVCWLEVHRIFDTRNLTPGVLYEVALVMMLTISASGWENPVNFRLTLPNGTKQEHRENFMSKPRKQWIEIPVGEFRTENGGEICIDIYQYGGPWKRGLVIKGVAIRPKN